MTAEVVEAVGYQAVDTVAMEVADTVDGGVDTAAGLVDLDKTVATVDQEGPDHTEAEFAIYHIRGGMRYRPVLGRRTCGGYC